MNPTQTERREMHPADPNQPDPHLTAPIEDLHKAIEYALLGIEDKRKYIRFVGRIIAQRQGTPQPSKIIQFPTRTQPKKEPTK
jgi:hypothetical protein